MVANGGYLGPVNKELCSELHSTEPSRTNGMGEVVFGLFLFDFGPNRHLADHGQVCNFLERRGFGAGSKTEGLLPPATDHSIGAGMNIYLFPTEEGKIIVVSDFSRRLSILKKRLYSPQRRAARYQAKVCRPATRARTFVCGVRRG